MRSILVCLAIVASNGLYSQQRQISGTYYNAWSGVEISFLEDQSFVYKSNFDNPIFYRYEPIVESGHFAISGDTLILNPGLNPKPFVETTFSQSGIAGDSVTLTCNHIRRYFDVEGKLVRADTSQLVMLDFAINEWKKSTRRRVAPRRQVRCTFAGFIPKEIITSDRSITIARPAEGIHRIFIGCYEMQGTKEFSVNDVGANEFTLDIFSNYYEDGQIRQMKLLIKNDKYIYTHQREDGSFERDSVWDNTEKKLKKINQK